MPRYDAYLLRIWRGGLGGEQWSGRLEHLPDGSTQRFASLEALLAHLGRKLAAEAAAGSPDNGLPDASSGVHGTETELFVTETRRLHGG
jgi:hypothetical protein